MVLGCSMQSTVYKIHYDTSVSNLIYHQFWSSMVDYEQCMCQCYLTCPEPTNTPIGMMHMRLLLHSLPSCNTYKVAFFWSKKFTVSTWWTDPVNAPRVPKPISRARNAQTTKWPYHCSLNPVSFPHIQANCWSLNCFQLSGTSNLVEPGTWN
jgi:hypothetical protein